MTDLPKFALGTACPKCGAMGPTGDAYVRWRWESTEGVRTEWLERVCWRCGYTWRERCLDAEEAGPPKAPGKVGQRETLVELLAASLHAEWADWASRLLCNNEAKHRERWWRSVASQYAELTDDELKRMQRMARRIIGDIDAWLTKEDPTRDALIEAAVSWHKCGVMFQGCNALLGLERAIGAYRKAHDG